MRGHIGRHHMPTWTYSGTSLSRGVDLYRCVCGVEGERDRVKRETHPIVVRGRKPAPAGSRA